MIIAATAGRVSGISVTGLDWSARPVCSFLREQVDPWVS